VINRLRLIGNLKARTPHSKMHGIHVNIARERFSFCWRHVCVFVFVNRGKNLHLFCSPLSNRLGEAKESRVRAGRSFRNKDSFSSRVTFTNSIFIRLLKHISNILVFRSHAIRCSKDRATRNRDEADFSVEALVQVILQVFAPKKDKLV
jgi:hypothetical protein